MEWVETTGRTIDEAKERALDELGVDEQDAEFEVVDEPKVGLFGRVRVEGRVRARVRPTAPRAKEDRRDRRRRQRGATGAADTDTTATSTASDENDRSTPRRDDGPADMPVAERPDDSALDDPAADDSAVESSASPSEGTASERSGSRRRGSRGRGRSDTDPDNLRQGDDRPDGGGGSNRRSRSTETPVSETAAERTDVDVALDEQGRVAEEFLRGLVEEFGLTADIEVATTEEDVDLSLTGDDLGLLIGPKGATLLAIQDLTRTVVQRKTGASNGRIHVDVSGYRRKRAEALAQFARRIADGVKDDGERQALEPMNAADRKVVHDALTEVVGVATVSEGEDPNRHIVIVPSEV